MPKAHKKKPMGQGARRASQRRATASKGGPVTLAQAKALARPQIQGARLTEAKLSVSLKNIGRQRQELHELYKRERKERTKEYTALMKIMKKRGVKGLTPLAQPLQIFAEGDSWFKYPVPNFGGAIIPRLEKLIGVPIDNLAEVGDEIRIMMDGKQRKKLIDYLVKGCSAGGPWDALLFSGGGNDVVNHLEHCIKDYDPAIPVLDHIDQGRYDKVIGLLRAGYEDLIAIRDASSPTTHLILHAYDFAIPDGRGYWPWGPWLEPVLVDTHHFPPQPRLQEKFEVIKEMLKQFAALLQSLVRKNVTFINAQGTLSPQPSSWHNEMHPEEAGFDRFAAIFHQQLQVMFPGRVM